MWLKLAARYWKPSKAVSKQSRPPPLDGGSRGPPKQKSRTAVLVLCSCEKRSSPRCRVVKTVVCVLVILGVLFLLLLVAGDVERNPGPTSESRAVWLVCVIHPPPPPPPPPSVVTVDMVDQLAALLCEEAAEWNPFLGQLGVSRGKRDELREEMAGRPRAAQKCLIEGLHHWVVSDESPTYEKIVAVFNGNFLTNRPLARKVEEFAQSVETVSHASATGDVIAGYADQMRGYYRTAIPQCFSLTWPPPPTRKVFNLSMISHDQYNYGRGNDELVMLLHLGNIEEFMAKKSSVELKNLFHLDEAERKVVLIDGASNLHLDERKVVLIEGAPGAGKSTLAWHICQKWKSGELFQEFKLVVFVQLRDPAIQSAKSLADLFPAQLKSVAREVVSRMETKGGEGLLFVLDGWDEFTPGLHGNELINNLICNPSAIDMPSSTLLITSRPIASGDLQQYASCRVETIGFKQSEIKLYFKEALHSETNKIKALEICLRNRPVIEASCYLPLNASIVVHLFRVDDTLPNTLHGVFLNLVINCIVRHILREGHQPPRISSLDDLPTDMQTQLSHICAMAYHGVMENKVTFSEDDMKAFNLPPDISTLSLIQGVESVMATYKLRSYNFLHLSVQELLTSYHISKLTPEEQVKIFKELFGQPRFAAVFQYYSAFTKLQTAGIQDIIVSIIQQRNKTLLLTLLHCLYEAQDSSLCQFVASELKGKLDLSDNSLSPVDCIAVGYFLHQCATICPMLAELSSKCSLVSYKLELLGKELKRPIQAVQFEVGIDFSSGDVDGNLTCTRFIATELIASASVISKLDLSFNRIQEDEDGLSHLCQALTTNTSLVELNLTYCRLTITEENGQALSHMLKTNKTLNKLTLSNNSINGRGVRYLSEGISSSSAISKLYLSHNPIQDGEDGLSHLCQALTTNTSLVELNLSYCILTITEENGQALSHMLKTNKTLNILTLSNNSINGRGVRYLSEGISSSSAISKLDLSRNPIQYCEDGLSHLCQALTTNTSLVELNLYDCSLHKACGPALRHMLETNKTLRALNLCRNHSILDHNV